jgi:hypothetical protein
MSHFVRPNSARLELRPRARSSKIREQLVDRLPIVADSVPHPASHGSFSMKVVLSALVPGLVTRSSASPTAAPRPGTRGAGA